MRGPGLARGVERVAIVDDAQPHPERRGEIAPAAEVVGPGRIGPCHVELHDLELAADGGLEPGLEAAEPVGEVRSLDHAAALDVDQRHVGVLVQDRARGGGHPVHDLRHVVPAAAWAVVVVAEGQRPIHRDVAERHVRRLQVAGDPWRRTGIVEP
ncbi:MAG: hypothetical protein J0H99_21255, partial [Rhodospirillales bacterium]|nr:hypothetical protein [Rhodospirillales bacterium]